MKSKIWKQFKFIYSDRKWWVRSLMKKHKLRQKRLQHFQLSTYCLILFFYLCWKICYTTYSPMMSRESLLSALRRPDIESVMLTSEDICFCLPADKTLSLHYIYYKVLITHITNYIFNVIKSSKVIKYDWGLSKLKSDLSAKRSTSLHHCSIKMHTDPQFSFWF